MGLPRRYLVLDADGMPTPPPGRRNIPHFPPHDHRSSGGFSCRKCFCFCYFFLSFFILLLCTTLAFIFFYLNPQLPSYTVDSLSVQKFDIINITTFYTELNVLLKAQNPNENIALQYGDKNSVIIMYSNNSLCSGQIPGLLQPPKNISMVNVGLKGQTSFDSQIRQQLLKDQKEKKIALDVKVNVPVTIVVYGTRVKEIPVFVKFKLTVNNLQPGQKVNAVPSDFQYGEGE